MSRHEGLARVLAGAAGRRTGGGPVLRAVPGQDGATEPSSGPGRPSRTQADAGLLESARRTGADHEAARGMPITRDALRARLGISKQLASDLLRQVRAHDGEVTAR